MTTAYIILGIWITILIIGILNILINHSDIKEDMEEDMEEYIENKDYPIGSKIKTEYGTVIVTEDNSSCPCINCVFNNTHTCVMSKCMLSMRQDKKNVIFKELE